MHLAAIVEQFWHSVPGGTALATAKTLQYIEKTGLCEITPLAAAHKKEADLAAEFSGKVKHSRLPRALLYETWLRTTMLKAELFIPQLDVTWAAAMVAPPTSKPLVTTVHDVDFLKNQELLSSRGKNFFPRAWEKALERSDVLVCPSQSVADDAVAYGASAEKTVVIPWGVETVAISDSQSLLQRFALPSDYILWVGTQEPRKNLANIVKALETTNHHLVIVGPRGWNIDSKELFASLGDRVHLVGWVDEVTLRAFYAQAKLFLFPSLAEGFGLPILEAMAQGTPVITSNVSAMKEIAGSAALLVNPQKPTSIANAITYCFEDKKLCEVLGEQGKKRAAEFSWTSTAQKYIDVFKKAAAA